MQYYLQDNKQICTSSTIPVQACTGPEILQKFEAPKFQENRHMKLVRLPTL